MAGVVGEADRGIIGAIGRVVAPAVLGGEGHDRDGAAGTGDAVGAVKHAAERESRDGGAAVAFLLVGDAAAMADGGAEDEGAGGGF